MADLLDKLGVDDTEYVRRSMRTRLAGWGVDTSHWRKSPRHFYTDEDLAAAVSKSTSVHGVLRTLGVPLSGGQHAHLARRIRRAGIDTSHFLGQAHNRGKKLRRRTPGTILVVLPPGSARVKAHLLRRAVVESGVEERCVVCGCDGPWLGIPLRTSTWCRKKSARPA